MYIIWYVLYRWSLIFLFRILLYFLIIPLLSFWIIICYIISGARIRNTWCGYREHIVGTLSTIGAENGNTSPFFCLFHHCGAKIRNIFIFVNLCARILSYLNICISPYFCFCVPKYQSIWIRKSLGIWIHVSLGIRIYKYYDVCKYMRIPANIYEY